MWPQPILIIELNHGLRAFIQTEEKAVSEADGLPTHMEPAF